jgi:hypothetical protein
MSSTHLKIPWLAGMVADGWSGAGEAGAVVVVIIIVVIAAAEGWKDGRSGADKAGDVALSSSSPREGIQCAMMGESMSGSMLLKCSLKLDFVQFSSLICAKTKMFCDSLKRPLMALGVGPIATEPTVPLCAHYLTRILPVRFSEEFRDRKSTRNRRATHAE